MIDPYTGEIWLCQDEDPLRPFMTVAEFLASGLAKNCHENMTFDRRQEIQYVIGSCVLAGTSFSMILSFQPTELRCIQMFYSGRPPAHNWFERLIYQWIPGPVIPAEQAKAIQDKWLYDTLGQTTEKKVYSWGYIKSVFNATLRGSWIEVVYEQN